MDGSYHTKIGRLAGGEGLSQLNEHLDKEGKEGYELLSLTALTLADVASNPHAARVLVVMRKAP